MAFESYIPTLCVGDGGHVHVLQPGPGQTDGLSPFSAGVVRPAGYGRRTRRFYQRFTHFSHRQLLFNVSQIPYVQADMFSYHFTQGQIQGGNRVMPPPRRSKEGPNYVLPPSRGVSEKNVFLMFPMFFQIKLPCQNHKGLNTMLKRGQEKTLPISFISLHLAAWRIPTMVKEEHHRKQYGVTSLWHPSR